MTRRSTPSRYRAAIYATSALMTIAMFRKLGPGKATQGAPAFFAISIAE